MTDHLCQLAGDWTGTVPETGIMAEVKADGFRALRFPGIDGKVRLWTRNGHVIEGTGHILHRLALMERAAGEPMMFDGEFILPDAGAGTLHATKEWCERGWKQGGEAGALYLFDAMPLREWRAGGSPVPLARRKARLVALAAAVDADPLASWEWREGSRGRDEGATPVRVAEHRMVHGVRGALELARGVWAAGGEGLMLKDPASPYRRKRSDDWRKVKEANKRHWWARAGATVEM